MAIAHRSNQRTSSPTIAAGRLVPGVKIAAIAIAAVMLTWLSLGVSATQLLRGPSADTALGLLPFDARAQTSKAQWLVTRAPTDPRAQSEVARLAKSALNRDATVVPAWRMIASALAVNDNRPQEANALFHVVERMSRRDVSTQIWLIGERMSKGDIGGAIGHYDVAMRSSGAAMRTLAPSLVAETSNAALIEPIARVLSSNPPWRRDFLAVLSGQAPSRHNALRILTLLSARGQLSDRDILVRFVQTAVDAGDYDIALRAYRLIEGRSGANLLVRNGDFETLSGSTPFDWQLANGSELRADFQTVPGKTDIALVITAASATGGVVARQLLTLEPGSYDISAVAGEAPELNASPIDLQIECAGATTASRPLTLRMTPRSRGGGRSAGQFQIAGPSCAAQWLTIGLEPNFGAGEAGGWVDAIRLSRR